MAKTEQLTLQDIIKSQEANKTGGMSAFMLAQLSAIEKVEKESVKIEEVTGQLTDKAVTELQGINVATHQTVSNIVKLTAAVEKNTKILSTPKSKNDLTETDIANQKVQKDQTGLLEKIANNTTPKKDKEEKGGIGGWLTLLVASLGAILGVLVGRIKVMLKALDLMTFGIASVLKSKAFDIIKKVPIFFEDMVTKLLINLEYGINIFKDFFSNRFPKIFAFIEKGMISFGEGFSKVFSFGEFTINKISKVVKTGISIVSGFFTGLTDAFKLMQEGSAFISSSSKSLSGMIEGIKVFFSGIGKWLGSFAKVFSGAFSMAKKISEPLMVIMGLFDGITEAIDNFKKTGSLMDAFEGFLDGFLKSVIGSMADLIKDLTSWVLGKLGFDEAAKFLDSFSFSDLIEKTLHSIFNFFKSIEIPEIGIDVFGKHYGAGPWHPFGNDTKETVAPPSAATPATKAPMTAIEPLPAFVPSLDAGGNPIISNGASIAPPQPNTANNVYKQSGTNKTAAAKHPPAQSTPIVVSAPVTNNKTNQQGFFKSPIRNTETSVNAFYKSRFVA